MKKPAIIENDTGLVLPEEARTGLLELNKVNSELDAFKERHEMKLPDCDTDEGYEKTKELLKDPSNIRIAVEKAHKAAKAPFWDEGQRIDTMKKTILAVTEPVEKKYREAIKAANDKKKAAIEAKEKAEAERVEKIRERIAEIKSAPSNSPNIQAVTESLERLKSLKMKGFDELRGEAEEVLIQSIKDLEEKHQILLERAEELKRLEDQRKEQEAAQAKIDAEKKRMANERAAFKAEKQAEADKQAEAERVRVAAAKAERDKKEAAEKAEADKVAAVAKAKEDERLRIEAEVEKAEDKRKRDEAKAAKLAAQAPDIEKGLSWLDAIQKAPKLKDDSVSKIVSDVHIAIETARQQLAELAITEAA